MGNTLCRSTFKNRGDKKWVVGFTRELTIGEGPQPRDLPKKPSSDIIIHSINWGELRPTRDQGPVTIGIQALSLVEETEPVQVHFTLLSRDGRTDRK